MSGLVTIVLPTFERAHVLRNTLASYVAQDGVDRILLVDDGGSTENARVLSELAALDRRVDILRNEHQLGAPRSRMAGVRHSSTRYVFFGEDDVVLSEGHVPTLLAHAQGTRAAICGGPVVYLRAGETIPDATSRYLSQPAHESMAVLPTLDYRYDQRLADDVRTPFLSAVMLVERSVFDDVQFDGGFRGNAYREETDFVLRAEQMGRAAVHCPHAIAFHLPRADAATGGQHNVPRWRYELASIMNNWRFVRRHGAYLRRFHGATGSNLTLQCRFVWARTAAVVRTKVARALKRIGR